MALSPGVRLGPYEIHSAIGAGGMGEVYRATDTNLRRQVAIKVLPESVATDPERLARFQREAEVLAALNHPHIAAIHGLEKSGGTTAIVMELVEGPTLADRIAQGPIPVDEALRIAKQIAEALEAAHEHGIVHRDLKPANVKVRHDGMVKVLDFGLAKGLSQQSSQTDWSMSPTITSPARVTGAGMILGTAAYMSPEQARGKAVDMRTDIWAFGCVMYEMLTGRRPFVGDSVTDTLAAIVEREPDWTALPRATPIAVRRLLGRSLKKDSKDRLRDIGDARFEIDEASTSPGTEPVESPDVTARRLTRWIAALAVTAVASAIIAWNLKAPSNSRSAVTRMVIAPPPSAPLAVDISPIVLSADGRTVAYVGGSGSRQQIYLRDLDQFNTVPIPGTEGGSSPFFSPDGQWVGFTIAGQLKRVLRVGGAPLTISDVPGTFAVGAEPRWEADDTILFMPALGAGIWRVSAAGGTPSPVTQLAETETSHRWPQLLPGGKALLFTVFSSQEAQVHVQYLETGQRREVAKGMGGTYLPTGHLAYVQAGSVIAVPFDPVRGTTAGDPVVVLSGVTEMTRVRNGGAPGFPQVAFSNAGTLAFVPASLRPRQDALIWVDRTGAEVSSAASGGIYFQPRLSPDGRRVAVIVRGVEHDDVWLYDLSREAWSRFTSQGNNAFPLWSPDGRTLTYVSDIAGSDNMYRKPLDGGGTGERLLASDRPNYPFFWSRDRTLGFVSVSLVSAQDILVLGEDKETKSLVETPFAEGAPVISPDGRWMAYVSNESGRNEVYVRPFGGGGERVTVSTDGGNEPVWPRSSRELFYRSGDAMMAVEIMTTPALNVGKPRRLFEKRYEPSAVLWPNYDVTSDGQRFLMVKRVAEDEAPVQINVVLNWTEELKRLVPTTP